MDAKWMCILELAQQLKALNTRPSMHYYINGPNPTAKWCIASTGGFNSEYHKDDMAPAYTLGELMEMLPPAISVAGEKYYISMDCDKQPYYAKMHGDDELRAPTMEDNDRTVDAWAKTAIWVLEQGWGDK